MGSIIVETIKQQSDLSLAAESNSTLEFKKILTEIQADLAIDFTTPEAVYENILLMIEANVRPVIGTTGLNIDQIKFLQSLCEKKHLGGIIAPNFSLGAVLMMMCSKLVARFMPNASIIEYHHLQKKDKPSGTSLKTAQIINDIYQNHHTHTSEIPIHSIRMNGIQSNQDVLFGNDNETLLIRHQTIDRRCHMPGLMLACRKVMQLNQLVYGLESLI